MPALVVELKMVEFVALWAKIMYNYLSRAG